MSPTGCACLIICDLQTSTITRHTPELGYCATEKKINLRVVPCEYVTWCLTLKEGHTEVVRDQGADEHISICDRGRKETIKQMHTEEHHN